MFEIAVKYSESSVFHQYEVLDTRNSDSEAKFKCRIFPINTKHLVYSLDFARKKLD